MSPLLQEELQLCPPPLPVLFLLCLLLREFLFLLLEKLFCGLALLLDKLSALLLMLLRKLLLPLANDAPDFPKIVKFPDRTATRNCS